MKSQTRIILLVGWIVLLLIASPAQATLFGFYNITSSEVSIGEAQLFVDVVDFGSGQISFTFKNIGPEASAIARVYFDDSLQLFTSLLTIDSSAPGVSFSANAKPPNLPAGNTVGFQQVFSAGADPAPSKNGINPDEYLLMVFALGDGLTFDNVISALTTGDLRIGLHAIAFANDGGGSFINNKTPVPIPASLLLLASGLFSLDVYRRKVRRKFRQ